jgi:hypothetical protein
MKLLSFFVTLGFSVICISCVLNQDYDASLRNTTTQETTIQKPTATNMPANPTATPRPQEFQTADKRELSNHFVIVTELESGNTVLYDLLSDIEIQLNKENEFFSHAISWDISGCELITSTWNSGIIQVNILGKPIVRLSADDSLGSSHFYYPALSPDGRIVAYLTEVNESPMSVRGGYMTTLSLFSLNVFNISNNETTTTLSAQKSVTEYKWSSQNEIIAYTDLDENGVHQLYIVDPVVGQRKQITTFSEKYSLVKNISWSSETNSLAFTHTVMVDTESNPEVSQSEQIYLSENMSVVTKLDLQTKFAVIYNVLFLPEDVLVIYGDTMDYSRILLSIDLDNKLETILFPEDEINLATYPIVYYPENGIAFFSYSGSHPIFNTLNMATGELKQYDTKLNDVRYFWGPPQNFPGFEGCAP